MKKIVVFGVLCVCMAAFFSCKLDQAGVEAGMLSDEQKQILVDLGMPINSGENPPDITGYYETDDLDCIEDTTGLFLQDLNYFYWFYDQSGNEVKLDYTNFGGDEATGKGAFIFGSGNDFTVYMETEGTSTSYGITYKTVNIYSGTLTPTGIENFTEGFIMTEKTGDDYDMYYMAVNEARIYEEGDGLAEELASDPGFRGTKNLDLQSDVTQALGAR